MADSVTTTPPAITDAIRTIVSDNGTNVEDAVSLACRRVRELPGFSRWSNFLIDKAIRDLVYSERHAQNVRIRNASGAYGAQPKVRLDGDSEVIRVHENCYTYNIAGRHLGDVLGSELESIGEHEMNRAKGHEFNARLCESLRRVVPPTKSVREAVPLARLQKLFSDLQSKE